MTAPALNATAIALLLEAFLESERLPRRAWTWRENNCCHFAGRWVGLVTARDVVGSAASVPGPREARRRAPDGLDAWFSDRLGCGSVPGGLAQLGDVVMVPVPMLSRSLGLGAALGVCGGRQLWVLASDGLPVPLPLGQAQRSWPLQSVLE